MAWPTTAGRIPGTKPSNPKLISALSTIAYCYQQKKEYKAAIEWYEKYLKVARPGSRGYEFAADNLKYIRAEKFMEEP